jgi:hypothetical protein
VSILANDEESNSFKNGKGLRQGDPLSPLLFNLVGDILSKMLARAAGVGLIAGLLEEFSPRVPSPCNMLMTPYCSPLVRMSV